MGASEPEARRGTRGISKIKGVLARSTPLGIRVGTLRAAPTIAVALATAAAVIATDPKPAHAGALEAVTLAGEKVRIDGLLREWPAKLDALPDVVQGSAGGGDPSATGSIGYDDKNVYVAMKIRDNKLVRTSSFGDHEDYGELDLAFPTEHGFHSYAVRLYAGVVGHSAGAVKLDGSQVHGARLVEAPADGGYVFEASIPWATFPESKRIRAGLRAALRYVDVDGSSVHGVVASSTGTGASMPPLLLEAEQGLYRTLVRPKGLSSMPARFGAGDVAGDPSLEAVSVFGGYLTIVGANYRGGKEFFYQDLGVGEASNITRFNVEDLTGDGKAEIVIGKRIGKRDDYREIVQILRVESGDSPTVVYQHETGIVTKEGSIRNDVSLKQNGSKVDLVIAQGKSEGFEPATYAEPVSSDMDPTLLPWDTVKSESYEWNGSKFALAGSEKWEPPVHKPLLGPPGYNPGKRSSSESSGDSTPTATTTSLPPRPRAPSPDELLERVYALYRTDRKVGIERPRFDFVADVAGDATPERVLIHGKDIVVFGKGFKEGMSYAYITIGVDSPKDVVDVTAKDVTGDGKAEIVVRGLLHAKESKQMGGKVVDRKSLFVYQVFESGLRRVFAAETGRALGDDSVSENVTFVPSGRSIVFELTPGRVVGWSESSYPFPIDKYPYGGLEPLLVPWGDVQKKRYHYDGSAYVADP